MPGLNRFERLRRVAPVALLLIVACALLAACGTAKNNSIDATEVSSSSESLPSSPTALSGSPRIGQAIWANAVDPQTDAPVGAATPVVGDATIYAVFPIESFPAGSQLIASWYFNETSLDSLSSAMRIDQDRVSGWLEFHIQQTGQQPWPDGRYEIVVTDGTNELQRSEITIS